METLKVIGHEKIGKIEFIGIEGGFGKGRKAMLVKDIALGDLNANSNCCSANNLAVVKAKSCARCSLLII